jgi:redox-sensitive bicupin YhaK (pirin superfamily)
MCSRTYSPARFMLMAGARSEPIITQAFVMNTQQEIQQALIDRNGTFVQN